MPDPTATSTAQDDSQLVSATIAGHRDAFGRIVERYQSLVCAVTYSATGNLSRSEDLAQETFLTAWRELRTLREPAKLRAWLCGIARRVVSADRRRQSREPAHGASRLESAAEVPGTEPVPAARAVTLEEAELLWREVGRLPETYREVLVLYYREQQSVVQVAAALELTEDAVMQRLSRGRKMLQERLLAFVEHALDRTRPGRDFKLRVDATLTLLVVGHQAAALTAASGMGSAKGAAVKGGLGGGLAALALPFLGALAAAGVSWQAVRQAPNETERRFARNWNIALWTSVGALLLGLRIIPLLAESWSWTLATTLAVNVGAWFVYLAFLVALLVVLHRRSQAGWAAGASGEGPIPAQMSSRTLLASYVATTAWIVGLAWVIGDGWTALGIAVATVLLATWNLRANRRGEVAAAEARNLWCHVGLCLGLLVIANLRIEHWVAPLYGLPVAAMREELPMGAIHGLSVALVGWAAVLVAATQPRTGQT